MVGRLHTGIDVHLRSSMNVRTNTSEGSGWLELQPEEDGGDTTITVFFPSTDEDRLLACDTLIAAIERIKATVRPSVRS